MIKLFIYIIFLSISTSLFGQKNDFMIWQSLSVNKELNKTNHIKFSQKFRIKDNATHPYKLMLQISWNHSFSKSISGKLNYRYIENEPFYNIEIGHRFFADISYKQKVNPFRFSWRTRFQSTYFNPGTDYFDSESYNRNKLTLSYSRKKLFISPYLEYEFFCSIDNFVFSNISEVRYGIGSKIKINKDQKLTLYYRLNKPLDKRIPGNLYILGVQYSIDI